MRVLIDCGLETSRETPENLGTTAAVSTSEPALYVRLMCDCGLSRELMATGGPAEPILPFSDRLTAEGDAAFVSWGLLLGFFGDLCDRRTPAEGGRPENIHKHQQDKEQAKKQKRERWKKEGWKVFVFFVVLVIFLLFLFFVLFFEVVFDYFVFSSV